MLRARLAHLLVALAATLVLPAAATADPVVRFGKVDRSGNVTLSVRGAGPTQRVTVPRTMARELAAQARRGGLRVSTARDGFTGNMLRLVAGSGRQAMIVDRMRRGGPNGQSGASALRLQVGGLAFHVGRTTVVRPGKGGKVIGRSGPSRNGAYLMGSGEAAGKGGLQWYFVRTGKKTTNVAAPLVPFNPYGTGSAGVTAQPARIVGAGALLGE